MVHKLWFPFPGVKAFWHLLRSAYFKKFLKEQQLNQVKTPELKIVAC